MDDNDTGLLHNTVVGYDHTKGNEGGWLLKRASHTPQLGKNRCQWLERALTRTMSKESTRMAMRHINTSPAIVPAKCPGELTAHFKLIKFEFKYKR